MSHCQVTLVVTHKPNVTESHNEWMYRDSHRSQLSDKTSSVNTCEVTESWQCVSWCFFWDLYNKVTSLNRWCPEEVTKKNKHFYRGFRKVEVHKNRLLGCLKIITCVTVWEQSCSISWRLHAVSCVGHDIFFLPPSKALSLWLNAARWVPEHVHWSMTTMTCLSQITALGCIWLYLTVQLLVSFFIYNISLWQQHITEQEVISCFFLNTVKPNWIVTWVIEPPHI